MTKLSIGVALLTFAGGLALLAPTTGAGPGTVGVPGAESQVPWQIAQYTKTPGGYPAAIHTGWPGLVFPKVDAALFWSAEKSYLFYNDSYVRYDNRSDSFDAGYPRKIRDGWTGVHFDRIDAAVKWPNGKTYFFRGNQYIRYDEASACADPGYPKYINNTTWPGLGFDRIDAAMYWPSGKTYFFRGGQYVRYDVKSDRADPGYPASIAQYWPGVRFGSLDGALEWGTSAKSFLISDTFYQRWDSQTRSAD